MSGIEIGIAVIGAVAALVTAYKDAGGIVENIKERRKTKGGLPPSTELEESLREGHEEIEKITAKGIQRFGADFEQGDDVAHRALQSLTIEVQASLLHHLRLASRDDEYADFGQCIDSAIEGRLKAVTILNELYLRQQKRSSLQSEPEALVCQAPVNGDKLKRSGTVEQSPEVTPGHLRRRTSSWNPFKSLRRTSFREQVSEKEVNTERGLMRTPSSTLASSPTVVGRSKGSISAGSPNGFHQSLTLTPPISPSSTFSSSEALTVAGFCKGAYYVQQGIYEKGVQVSMKNMEWSCHCRKCGFATPADRDQRGRPRFDDKIYDTARLRFRPLLLFKSHLSSSQKKRRVYRCLICVLGGDTSSTYEGEQHLLEHISRHQGSVVNGVEMVGGICLDAKGSTVGKEESFDMWFPPSSVRFSLPPSAVELDTTEIVEADDGVELPDEVYKNEWVNEGRKWAW